MNEIGSIILIPRCACSPLSSHLPTTLLTLSTVCLESDPAWSPAAPASHSCPLSGIFFPSLFHDFLENLGPVGFFPKCILSLIEIKFIYHKKVLIVSIQWFSVCLPSFAQDFILKPDLSPESKPFIQCPMALSLGCLLAPLTQYILSQMDHIAFPSFLVFQHLPPPFWASSG